MFDQTLKKKTYFTIELYRTMLLFFSLFRFFPIEPPPSPPSAHSHSSVSWHPHLFPLSPHALLTCSFSLYLSLLQALSLMSWHRRSEIHDELVLAISLQPS